MRHEQALRNRERSEGRLQLQVYVRVGDEALRDQVEFDIGAASGVLPTLMGACTTAAAAAAFSCGGGGGGE